jgi:peptidoglycan hydrolase CwlO-like protein
MFRTNRKQKLVRNTFKQNQPKIKKRFVLVTLLLGLVMAGASVPVVRANLQEQINQLSQQNAGLQGQTDSLANEATTLQGKVDALQAKINALQTEINDNQTQISALEGEIVKAEAELAKQKDLLGQNIRAMYVEGDISTLEMLASSQDLSEFVDKQQYRNSVQSKIKDTLDKVNTLKHQLNGQRETLQRRVDDHKRNQTEVAKQKSIQDELLGLNQGQRDSLDSQIRGNSKRIEELKRQQAVENMRLFGGGAGVLGGGGYPWGYAACLHTGQVDGPCANYDWAVNGSIWNPNTGGYGYRNCTDYVSWRIRSQGGYVPAGLGNAKDWDNNYPSDNTPSPGDAAVSNAGTYGHVMYVEAVNGNQITISDYNRAGTGKYATSTISASGLSFLTF